MMIGSRDFSLFGRPLLPPGQVEVEATVVEKTLSRTKYTQLFKKRENFRRVRFMRDRWTLLRINEINFRRCLD